MDVSRYERAYPHLFDGLGAATRRLVLLSISTTPSGALVAEGDVRDLIERVTGRISFEEYTQRGRRPRAV